MSKKSISARGELVDFDLLSIKQQLATTPVPVGVTQRRKFIDQKEGIRTKEITTQKVESASSALNIAIESVAASEAAAQNISADKKSSSSNSKNT